MLGDGEDLTLILGLFPTFPISDILVKVVWSHLGGDSLEYLDAIQHLEELAWGSFHGDTFTLFPVGQAQAVLAGVRNPQMKLRAERVIQQLLCDFPSASTPDYGY